MAASARDPRTPIPMGFPGHVPDVSDADVDGSNPAGKYWEDLDGSVPEGKTWEEEARERQQELYDLLSDRYWNSYNVTELEYLLRVIGHALHGPPDEEPSFINRRTGYTKEKLEDIQKICETIQQQDQHYGKKNETYMAVVFVILKVEFNEKTFAIPEAVFRVPKHSANGELHVFIDRHNRVYNGWEKYLNNNKLQECSYCYPFLGVYSDDGHYNVLVEFGTTPAGSVTRKVLGHVDTAGTIVSVGAALVGLASLVAIPVAAPILLASAVGGGAVGIYGAGRSAEVLVDRGLHGQSVSLAVPEARNSWIGFVGSTVGLAAAGATTAVASMARNGEVLGKTGRFVVNAMQLSSITVNGIGIISGAVNLHEKYKSDNLTPLDIFQFSSSLLFFTNSAMNTKTASTIIKENQKNVLSDYRANLRSNRHRKGFDRLARNTRRGNDTMAGNAKVIKGIKTINNPDDFFSGVVRIHKHHKKSDAKMSFTDTNQVDINGKVKVEPTKFADIDKDQRQKILDASKKFDDGSLSSKRFNKIVNPIYKDNGLDMSATQPTQNTMSDICKALDVKNLRDVDTGHSTSHFSKLNSAELQRFGKLLIGELGPKVWGVVITLIKNIDVNVAEFMEFLEFSFEYVKGILYEMEATYHMLLEVAMTDRWFNRESFDRDNGIVGDRTDHFLRLIQQMHLVGQKCVEYKEAYQQWRAERRAANNQESFRSEDDPAEVDNNMDNRGSSTSDFEGYDDDRPTFVNSQPYNQPNNVNSSQSHQSNNNFDQSGPSTFDGLQTAADYFEHRDFKDDGSLTEQEQFEMAIALSCMHVDDQPVIHDDELSKADDIGTSADYFEHRDFKDDGSLTEQEQFEMAIALSCMHVDEQPVMNVDELSNADDLGTSAHYSKHRDFKVEGSLTDQEHYDIATELSCSHVDASVAMVKRRDEESFVIFLGCDIVVTIHSDAVNSRVTANLIDGK